MTSERFDGDASDFNLNDLLEHGGEFNRTLGIAFDGTQPDGTLVGHLDCDQRHHQPMGLVHGGVWAAVVETFGSVASGLQLWPQGKVSVGVSNHTNFFRAHRTGRVNIIASPQHLGRSQHVWEVTITAAESGKALATGILRLQVLDAQDQLAGASLVTND